MADMGTATLVPPRLPRTLISTSSDATGSLGGLQRLLKSAPYLFSSPSPALSPFYPPIEGIFYPLSSMPDYFAYEYTLPGHSRSRSFSSYQYPLHYTRPFCADNCADNCARVSPAEWNNLIAQERSARTANAKLARENQDLQAKIDRLRSAPPPPPPQRDDKLLRRRAAAADALRAELEGKELDLRALQKENDVLKIRVRELTETVRIQNDEATAWESQIRRSNRAHSKDRRELGVKAEEAREAWNLVDDLRRQLRRCRDPLSFRGRYSFGLR
ncbi:hypothetical protein F4825DRAFT_455975 [Nemania diffusa]|nr:hypothetical protein F4825DRAFT_455975 [Nemania diffusa]